ncbi:MAG: hypothetical protein ACR2PZ_24060, partial [Pseudomonadales bacterium]
MKVPFIVAIAFAGLLTSRSAAQQQHPPRWNNLEVLAEHRELPRATAFPFPDETSASDGAKVAGYYRSPFFQLL